ncbi:hypothetical protein AB0M32_36075 [Streptomyces sp. NPDC051985]
MRTPVSTADDPGWGQPLGLDEIRRLKAATVTGLPFPHADQVL